MNPVYLTVTLTALSLACTAANLIVTLKIRVAQLESEKRVLDQVHRDYVPRELCTAAAHARA